MSFLRKLTVFALAAMIALAPAIAEARAGGSTRSGGGTVYQSQGSRGSRTHTPDGAQPVQRSVTQPSTTGSSTYGYTGSFWNRHPFLTALAGGFFGAWIGSWLFPSWGWGGMVGGSIISWLLIIMLAMFLVRAFRRSAFATMGPPVQGFYESGWSYGPGPVGSVPASAPLTITQQDHAAFESLLKSVQAAWSAGDLTALRRHVTPEMLSYFSEALSNNASQGVENRVEQVTLLSGDVRESWDEGALQYATALLRWSALDYNVRAGLNPGDPGYVVEGGAERPVEAQEMWTFVRSPGGHWLLSAIQQV
jgi:hypothetical protein